MTERVNRETGEPGWPDLQELARPFPTDFVERKDGADYVAHHVVNQRLLSIVGPFDFELVQVIRGDIAAVAPDPTANSRRGKAGTPALQQIVVGGIWRLTCAVDGRQVRVEEVGDVGDVHNWKHDGARLKDAASDAIKRCAMRLSLGLSLWAQEHYFLDKQLAAAKPVTQEQPAVPLYNAEGKVERWALVDADDLEEISKHRWFWDGHYPACKVERQNVRLHRMLMGDPPETGLEVDHRNLDPLDNRRDNLRWVTHAENSRNAPSQPGTSRFRGVSWDQSRGKWKAQARYDYVMYFLGRYDSEDDAYAAVQAFWMAPAAATNGRATQQQRPRQDKQLAPPPAPKRLDRESDRPRQVASALADPQSPAWADKDGRQ